MTITTMQHIVLKKQQMIRVRDFCRSVYLGEQSAQITSLIW